MSKKAAMPPAKSSAKEKEMAAPAAKKMITQSERAGLTFPVGRVRRLLQNSEQGSRISRTAGVYMASVLEYLAAEVVELSGACCKENRKRRIIPRHIQLAVHMDDELNKLFENVIISDGGVLPHIESILLPKKTQPRLPNGGEQGHYSGEESDDGGEESSAGQSQQY